MVDTHGGEVGIGLHVEVTRAVGSVSIGVLLFTRQRILSTGHLTCLQAIWGSKGAFLSHPKDVLRPSNLRSEHLLTIIHVGVAAILSSSFAFYFLGTV